MGTAMIKVLGSAKPVRNVGALSSVGLADLTGLPEITGVAL